MKWPCRVRAGPVEALAPLSGMTTDHRGEERSATGNDASRRSPAPVEHSIRGIVFADCSIEQSDPYLKFRNQNTVFDIYQFTPRETCHESDHHWDSCSRLVERRRRERRDGENARRSDHHRPYVHGPRSDTAGCDRDGAGRVQVALCATLARKTDHGRIRKSSKPPIRSTRPYGRKREARSPSNPARCASIPTRSRPTTTGGVRGSISPGAFSTGLPR